MVRFTYIFLVAMLPFLISCGKANAADCKDPEKSGLGKIVLLRNDILTARKAAIWSVSFLDLNKWSNDCGLKIKLHEKDLSVGSVVDFLDANRSEGQKSVRDILGDAEGMVPFGIVSDAVLYYYSEDTLSEFRIIYNRNSGTAFFWSSSN